MAAVLFSSSTTTIGTTLQSHTKLNSRKQYLNDPTHVRNKMMIFLCCWLSKQLLQTLKMAKSTKTDLSINLKRSHILVKNIHFEVEIKMDLSVATIVNHICSLLNKTQLKN